MVSDGAAGFSPYRDLLGIAVNGQRPNYYELLGLANCNVGAAEVDAAYERQIAKVRSQATGEQRAICHRLEEELGAARHGLRDAAKKRDYDLQLHTQSLLRPLTRDDMRERQKTGRWRSVVPPRRPAAVGAETPRAQSVPASPSANSTPAPLAKHPPERSLSPKSEGPTDSVYDLLRVIGRGSTTTVYEAYDHSLRRYVAIRQLDKEVHDDPHRSEFFWKEARFFASLDHENLVSVFTVDSERGWVIMDLMRCNLRDKLAEGPLPADAVRSVLRQVLRGLSYLHGQEKLHGEIKPSSILIDDQGRVKLSDSPGFNIGAEFRMPTGSQLHVAPELLSPDTFGQVGQGVDLYCLGFAMLELLLGDGLVKHFKGIHQQNAGERTVWMRWHTSPEALPPTKEMVPKLPDDLALVIDRLIKKQVAERYPSADAALADLDDRPLILLDPSPRPAAAEGPTPAANGPAAKLLGTPPRPRAAEADKPNPPSATSETPRRKPTKLIADRPVVFYSLCGLGLCALLLVLLAGLSSPPPPPQPVEMQIGSQPVGATVYVNGNRLAGTTPTTATVVPGNYELKWEMDGFETATRSVTVRQGERNTFIGDLAPTPHQPPIDRPLDGPPTFATSSPEPPPPVKIDPTNQAENTEEIKTSGSSTIDGGGGGGGGDDDGGGAVTTGPTSKPEDLGSQPSPPTEVTRSEITLCAEFLPIVGGPLSATETDAFGRHVRAIIIAGSRDPSRAWESHFGAATRIAVDDPRPYHAAAIVLFQRAFRFHETTARSQAFGYLQQAVDKLRDDSISDQIPYFDPWRHHIYLLLVQDDRSDAVRECYFLAKRIASFTRNSRHELRCQAELDFVTQSLGCLQEATDSSASLAPYKVYDAEIAAALDNQPEMKRLYRDLRTYYAERMRHNRDRAGGHLAMLVPRQNLDVLGDQLLRTLPIEYYGG